jgi:hypothetical protein
MSRAQGPFWSPARSPPLLEKQHQRSRAHLAHVGPHLWQIRSGSSRDTLNVRQPWPDLRSETGDPTSDVLPVKVCGYFSRLGTPPAEKLARRKSRSRRPAVAAVPFQSLRPAVVQRSPYPVPRRRGTVLPMSKPEGSCVPEPTTGILLVRFPKNAQSPLGKRSTSEYSFLNAAPKRGRW